MREWEFRFLAVPPGLSDAAAAGAYLEGPVRAHATLLLELLENDGPHALIAGMAEDVVGVLGVVGGFLSSGASHRCTRRAGRALDPVRLRQFIEPALALARDMDELESRKLVTLLEMHEQDLAAASRGGSGQ